MKNLDLLERVPKCFLLSAGVYLAFQLIGCSLLFEKKTNPANHAQIDIDDEDQTRRLNETPTLSETKCHDVNSLGVWLVIFCCSSESLNI